MPSSVRTARAPTDLKPNLIRVKKRDDERAHRREGGERVKEFQHLGTSDRVVGRPRTECAAKSFYCECMHPQLVNAILTNICSIVTHTVPRPAVPGRIVRVYPTRLRFQNIPDRRAIRDTISIENDAPRVNVWERGRPSFQLLLNARDPTPGHSYLRFRRKCLLPSAPRVRLRTLNRTSYESRNAMTNEPASDDGGWLRYPKKTGQTPVRSLPRKENGKARTWMDEKSVRKSHGHHIPPAKGDG